MDSRRASRAVIDPKVRHVGFVTPNAPPDRAQSFPQESNSSPLSASPASNTLSPVMIPPPRHPSENLTTFRTAAIPVPEQTRLRAESVVFEGSYDPTESLSSSSFQTQSPPASSRLFVDEEFSEESWLHRNNSAKFASSSPAPGCGFNLTSVKEVSGGDSTVISEVKKPAEASANEKNEASNDRSKNALPSGPSSKSLKAKTTKSERRALQESQRAAKAAAKAQGNKPAPAASSKAAKQPSQKKEASIAPPSAAASEKKGTDRPSERERKKDAPAPRMQFDDKSRVEKAKKRALVNQTEARNRVEYFRHLPQYEYGTQLPDLQSKLFQLDPMHPAVHKVGLQYLAGDVTEDNGRCIAMLQAFSEAIRDYTTPDEKVITRDLTAKIGSYVSFLIECRPLSTSMGNAIRFLKSRIVKLPLTLSESEAKASLCSDIDRFINEKIVLADKVIVRHATTKIRDGDVILTYGAPSVVEMILTHAHELGKQFRVVIVDSRPNLEGQSLLRRLVTKGLKCTYTHLNAVSYIMHEVSRVFLGASSILSNGIVYSRVGTASVAMVAHAFCVPVLVCCEAYKFHERVQLDSICFNELGDPNDVAKVPGRRDINYLDSLDKKENLQLLNLMYDATPSDYISMVVTDYGMIPPTSVPVIVREYRQEQLWI
ncbi:hypothetical protein SAY87_004270 [Trapa incisa]|uniref:Translation initiation factor eIF2B subunit delta n=1 Tax=Trapa incisa TaxID=236973 RepID=A0AAN7JRJ8_9MYRT|nr:hypothetical protein SAY87_004270 [Trapa incisa]